MLPRHTFTLGNFVLMVRKDQIDTTSVNIESLSQILHTHSRTLDVPPWTTATNLRVPKHITVFLWFVSFPQHKVAHVILAIFINIYTACASFHAGGIQMSQLPIL